VSDQERDALAVLLMRVTRPHLGQTLAEMTADAVLAAGWRPPGTDTAREALDEAITDTLWRMTPYGETEDGDIAHYLVSKGTVHRLVATAQSAGITSAALRNTWVPEPEESAPVREVLDEVERLILDIPEARRWQRVLVHGDDVLAIVREVRDRRTETGQGDS